MSAPILAPAAALVIWSLIVLLWMVLTRFPGLKKAGLAVKTAPPGIRYTEVESAVEPRVNWVSHNYTHLMEQPTLFYATVMILALCGEGVGLNVTLAWAYVGLRVIHSLWQTQVNTLLVRICIFALSSTVLIVLAINALIATVFAGV